MIRKLGRHWTVFQSSMPILQCYFEILLRIKNPLRKKKNGFIPKYQRKDLAMDHFNFIIIAQKKLIFLNLNIFNERHGNLFHPLSKFSLFPLPLQNENFMYSQT